MPNAIVNPEMLRAFADKLNYFAENVDGLTQNLVSKTDYLGQTWRDDGFEAFHDRIQRAKETLHRLRDEVLQVVPKLRSDAQAVENYQKINIKG